MHPEEKNNHGTADQQEEEATKYQNAKINGNAQEFQCRK